MADSAVPTVKDALATIFGAAAPLDGVTIARGIVDQAALEQIVIFNAKVKREWAGLGRSPTRLDEMIRQILVVEVLKRDTIEVTEERSWAILAAMENLVRADPRLGLIGTVTFAEPAQFDEVEQTGFRVDRREGARITAVLAMKTRI